MAKLTKGMVDGAETRAAPYFLWCSELPGFGVRVFPSGKRVYYADYRSKLGGRKRMSLGPHGKLTTEEARKLARITLGSVLTGEDPALERKTRRKSLTVAQLCDQYLADAGKGLILGKGGRPKKASTLSTDAGRVERHIKPLLGKKLVIDLKQSDISRFVKDVTAGKTAVDEKTDKKRGRAIVEGGAGAAARTTGLLGGILSYAVSEGVIENNPARGVKRPSDKKKERRLTPDEYKKLGKALDAADEESWQAVAGIRLLALTGCRLSEIKALDWSVVNFDAQMIRFGDTKTGEQFRPLSHEAINALRSLPREKKVNWVLSGVREPEAPYGGLPGAIKRIAKKAGISGLSAHVLRHSFASVAGDLDYSEATIGVVIGHAGKGITSRYVHRLDSVLIAAANKISGEVYRQMTGESGKVVALPRRA